MQDTGRNSQFEGDRIHDFGVYSVTILFKLRVLAMLTVLGSLIFISARDSHAFGGDSGGGDGGCCWVPENQVESAKELWKSMEQLSLDEIRRIRSVGEICKSLNCGNVPEETAIKIAADFIYSTERREDRAISIAGVIAAIFAATISMLSLLQSRNAKRDARLANDRSIRNETMLSQKIEG